jgi:hypothetical protein
VNSLHGYPDPTNDVAEAIGSFLTPPKQAVFAKYGIQTKPLWDTEGSWGDESAGAITDPDLQMAFVARSFLLHWSLGFSRFIWYMWEDDPGGWGYFLDDQTKILRPAAMAYRQVYNWMVGAILTQPCSVNGGTVYHAMYTCDFTRSSGYQARAVWNTDGASTYTAPSEFTQYRDLAGNTHSMPSNHQVPIGLKPILLENF